MKFTHDKEVFEHLGTDLVVRAPRRWVVLDADRNMRARVLGYRKRTGGNRFVWRYQVAFYLDDLSLLWGPWTRGFKGFQAAKRFAVNTLQREQ